MTCEDAHLQMHDYISGELAKEHHGPLMDHLDSCPHCRKFFDQTRQMLSSVRSAMREDVPSELQNAVHDILANA
jgi:anti-sigma factor RsiW